MNASSEDSYKETMDYIKQIENEIMFSLDETHLNDFAPNQNINSFCDILLDKVNQNIVWTNEFDENIVSRSYSIRTERSPKSTSNENDKTPYKDLNNSHSIKDCKTLPIPKTQSDQSNFSWTDNHFHKENGQHFVNNCLSLDRVSNYRYSFYDNSTKFSIYLANSKLVDQVCIGFVNEIETQKFNLLQIENDGRILPEYIENALIYLSTSGLSSVGIFRKSGVKSRINTLREKINQKEKINFESLCIYDVADLVKTWLRDLKPHLLTNDLIEKFTKKESEFNLWHLSDSHRYLLFVVLRFLSMVSSYSQQNQMTTQNLAICFAPSLCDGENEKQINRAQKCLQYCIENYESLFYLTLKEKFIPNNAKMNSHTSVLIIDASPLDILNRLLYERNVIDKLISRWNISNQNENSDIFEFDLQFSWLLPAKTFNLKRVWGKADTDRQGGLELKENGDLICSKWIMVPNGKGQSLVKHDISLELRGLSSEWYKTTFSLIHDQQLKRLQSSFKITIPNNIENGTNHQVISEV